MAANDCKRIPIALNAASSLKKHLDNMKPVEHQVHYTLSHVDGEVALCDVVFAYPMAPKQLVLNHVSLSIAARNALALCGPSGSGKSSTITLIERFYSPQGGS